jgi:3-hydroxyacyl-CoA dehydrogenase
MIPFHRIQKVAILGSGVMGSRIACHFAQTGSQVLLLDLPAATGPRNSVAAGHLAQAIASNPSPLYLKSFADRIQVGNFEDDWAALAGCDWILEAVVERLDVKQQLFEKLEAVRKPGTLVSTNTSGIPIAMLTAGRSDDFRRHFCGTHFFNPPRYLPLLEIIPGPETAPEVVEFLGRYGEKVLGKQVVLCKDTPAFIANRVGVFAIQALFHAVTELGLTVEQVDKLTGPVMGRPKSATFRTCDVVGLDTLALVARGVAEHCPDDERRAVFAVPGFVQQLLDSGRLGAKSGAGFYKKVTTAEGASEILALDLATGEYRSQEKVRFATLEAAKAVDDLAARTRVLWAGTDVAGAFYRRIFADVFAYVTHRVPEIADQPYAIDDALRAGFGWEMGAFEAWDAVGLEAGLEAIRAQGGTVAGWVERMQERGATTFYRNENGTRQGWNPATERYENLPGQEGRLSLAWLPAESVVWSNSGTTLQDLGDGILNVAFHTKMNSIGGEVLEGLNHAIDLAEQQPERWRGVVVSNEGAQFSAGANVGMIFMLAVEQEWDQLDFAVRMFQKTMMRMRYSGVPVVAAPHGLALGGGCELCLHADKVVAHAETYMGLVEFGIGVIPAGGGTKEFALRLSDELREGDIRTNRIRERFLTIGQAKVSTSAHEAFALGYLRPGLDTVVMNRRDQLAQAKRAAIQLAEAGYVRPQERRDIWVSGNEGLGLVYVGAHSMQSGGYISEHDQLISEKLGYVLSGGDLSERTRVSEQYLLDLERRAFVELCMQRKTLERMQSLIQQGKILRN